MFLSYCRGFLFYIMLAIITMTFAIPLLLEAFICKEIGFVSMICYSIVRFFLNLIMGLHIKYEGAENIPDDGDGEKFIFASKHQSTLDILALTIFIPRDSFVLKNDLIFAPVIGLCAYLSGMVFVDKNSKKLADLRLMIEGVKRNVNDNKNIIFFPEGNRKNPYDENRDYKAGLYSAYKALKTVRVIPVALNTGMFWPRLSFRKMKGVAKVRFLPPIEAGLSKKEFMSRLVDEIESNSLELREEAEGVLKKIYKPEDLHDWLSIKTAGK